MTRFSMSSFDVRRMASEMQGLIGGFLEKAYQPGYTTVVLRFNAPSESQDKNYEKTDVLMEAGALLAMGRFDIEMPKTPSTFAMTLRKHLANARVRGVRQHEFDRILVLELETKFGVYELVLELFANGNLILIKDGIIVQPLTSKSWKHREVKTKQEFKFPPAKADPQGMEAGVLQNLVYGSDSDLVRTLVSQVNIPPKYAEEACLRGGFDKNRPAKELAPEEVEELAGVLKGMFDELESSTAGYVYFDGEEAEAVSPIPLKVFEELDARECGSLSEALKVLRESREEGEDGPPPDPEALRLKRLLESQEASIAEFAVTEEENRFKGDCVYENYKLCEEVLANLLKAKEQFGWDEVEKRAASIPAIGQLNTKDGYVVVPLKLNGEGRDVKLDLTLDVNQNAAVYYERAKKAKEKIKGAQKAVGDTQRKLARVEKEGVKKATKQKREATRRFWFDRFRWFISSEGNLVIGGRDASTNDRVVKKHMDTGDRYAHADLHGAPSIVIKKQGDEAVGEKTLEEACHFALIYSKAWNAGIGSGTAYWVKAEQVSKTPAAGEFLAKGAFIVRGKRNIVNNIPLVCAVGEIDYEGAKKIMGGPVESLEARSGRYVELVPGDRSISDAANELSELFNVMVDDILSHMPPGKVRIGRRVGL